MAKLWMFCGREGVYLHSSLTAVLPELKRVSYVYTLPMFAGCQVDAETQQQDDADTAHGQVNV